jgi:putative hydrolase of the HAD superfamily
MSPVARALLFDVGDVLLKSNWECLDAIESMTGRPIPGRGPLDPGEDPIWQRYLDGTVDVMRYWDEVAEAGGFDGHLSLWQAMGRAMGRDVFAPAALELVHDAKAAGRRVGILSNDLYGGLTKEWVAASPEFALFDVIVDATEFGARKPAPEPYLEAARQLGVAPDEIVFLDDMPMCVEGARNVGMQAVLVDPLDLATAFQTARELAGLEPSSRAREIVAAANTAWSTEDADTIARLFHPEIVIRWNGQKLGAGLNAARRFADEQLRAGSTATRTLRAAQGDTIAVVVREPAGDAEVSELWTMRGNLVIELDVYGTVTSIRSASTVTGLSKNSIVGAEP